jgi:mono/diheme cytochrome c family protein
VIVTVLWSLPEPGRAQTALAPDNAAIDRGRVLFGQHCAVCHGKEGKGDGPTATTLASKPTNLTLMQHAAIGPLPTRAFATFSPISNRFK